MKKKIIITGGLGFIGLSLVEKLSKKYEIIIIDRAKKKLQGKKLKIVRCDITYLKSDDGTIYDMNTQAAIGYWNSFTDSIEFEEFEDSE